MATEIDVVRQGYDRFAQGDLNGFLHLCSQDIEWVVNGAATLEKCQTFRGKQGVEKFLAILSAIWQFDSFTPANLLKMAQLL